MRHMILVSIATILSLGGQVNYMVQAKICPKGQIYEIVVDANTTSRPEAKCVAIDEKK